MVIAQVQVEVQVEGSAGWAEFVSANWWWLSLSVFAGLCFLWFLRRRFRELRRREPWSAERAMWAWSGFFPTGRLFRKWGRFTGRRRYTFRGGRGRGGGLR